MNTKMNIKVNITVDDNGWVFVQETDASAKKRIAQTFGFDEKKIDFADSDEYGNSLGKDYNGSLLDRAYIKVCGFTYEVRFDYANGNHKVMSW